MEIYLQEQYIHYKLLNLKYLYVLYFLFILISFKTRNIFLNSLEYYQIF